MAIGARMAASRLRSRTLAVLAFFGVVTVLVVALLERRTGSVLSADRTLAGIALGLALPFIAYGVVRVASGGQRLSQAVWPAARHGQSRRSVALGLLFTTTLLNTLLGAFLAAVSVMCVRFPADPLLVSDMLNSAWIGGLGGAVYTALFLCGATLGRLGGGAFIFLGLDFALGTGTGLVAAIWPRSHIRNLLGAAPPLELPQYASSLFLLASFLLMVTFATRRTPK